MRFGLSLGLRVRGKGKGEQTPLEVCTSQSHVAAGLSGQISGGSGLGLALYLSGTFLFRIHLVLVVSGSLPV